MKHRPKIAVFEKKWWKQFKYSGMEKVDDFDYSLRAEVKLILVPL